MANKIKVEHYVPQFYLKYFVAQEKGNRLYCFDKRTMRIFLVNIRNVACESSFYDSREDIHQGVEKGLSKLETLFDSAMRNLLDTEDIDCLSSLDRLHISYFIAVQELRTSEFRTRLLAYFRGLREGIAKQLGTLESSQQQELERLCTEEGTKSMHLSLLEDVPEFAEILFSMNWMLLINQTSIPYYTSDNPVNRYNPIDRRPRGNLGLLCKGIEIHFPISPKITLCCGDPTIHNPLYSRYEISDPDSVTFQNYLQVYGSKRYLFSNNKDFSVARNIIKDYPKLAASNRKRVSVIVKGDLISVIADNPLLNG